ncbi:MAG: hypothetical protein EXR43_06075 [Dehalococcoidia bacterium]|nr:hypothetical protein [Dehalococcoidia bacterium]
MQVVLLAAGDGGRLQPLTADHPKALLEVAGTPLIDRVIAAFTASGLREFIIVVGYCADQIEAHLEARADADFRFVRNPDFRAGNARSLACALPLLGDEPFLMAMGDHLVSPDMVRAALAASPGANYLVIDGQPPEQMAKEATLVLIDEDKVLTDIGKHLHHWNAVDTGLFRLEPDTLRHVTALPLEAELSQAWLPLLRQRQLRAIDATGQWWADIDTEADLEWAEAHLIEGDPHGARRPGLTPR